MLVGLLVLGILVTLLVLLVRRRRRRRGGTKIATERAEEITRNLAVGRGKFAMIRGSECSKASSDVSVV